MAASVIKITDNLLAKAKTAEQENNLEESAKYYEEIIASDAMNEFAYTRLMIIYRKLKRYKDELRVIKQGINAFQNYFSGKLNPHHSNNKKVKQLSNSLLKSLGLQDKKGHAVYYPEPVGKWQIRKQVVEKKLKK